MNQVVKKRNNLDTNAELHRSKRVWYVKVKAMVRI